MRDSQALSVVQDLVQKIDAYYGSLGGAISVMIVVIVGWIALKELFSMARNGFEHLNERLHDSHGHLLN